MRLLLISIGTVFVVFLLFFMTRMWGLGVAHVEFAHPFFAKPATIVVVKVKSQEEITAAIKEMPDVAIWLDVQTTSDKKLIVFFKELSQKEMSVEAYRGPQPFAYSLQQLVNQNPKIKALQDIIAAYPDQRFVVNIRDNVEDVHLWVIDAMKGHNPEKRILLQSNYNVIMESIKKLEPFLIYGTSQADLMRFLAFESLWILPATPFKGDVYMAPFKLLKRPAFHAATIEEVRRRHKKVLLGPVLSKAEFDDAARLKPDGLIVENLSDYLSWARP